jgi:hypothetical protein
MSKKSTLQQLFPAEWREDMPSNLVQLLAANYEDLDDKAKALRALAVELVHSHERQPVLTAETALRLIEKHHLPVLRGRWIFHVLTKERERLYVKGENGAMRQLNAVHATVPSPAYLAEKAPLPEGGTYLVAYGGGPEVLENEQFEKAFAKLRSQLSVSDAILWQESGTSATFWSLRAGKGQCGTSVLDFPDQALAERWWA